MYINKKYEEHVTYGAIYFIIVLCILYIYISHCLGVQSEEEMLQQALAMSLEAGRQPQSNSGTQGSAVNTGAPTGTAPTTTTTTTATTASSEPILQSTNIPDFSAMTEEEQIAYAMQISMQDCSK